MLVSCADSLQLSFQLRLSHHGIERWLGIRTFFSAKCDNASKLLQSLVGKLRALQTSMCLVKLGQALQDRRKANSVPVIIEQTAAEQKTSCRLSDPNAAVRFFFMVEPRGAVVA